MIKFLEDNRDLPTFTDDISGATSTSVKSEVLNKPVTSMMSTFWCCTLNSNALNIPETVKYMFCSFRRTRFLNDCENLKIPETVEYASHLIQGSESLNENFKFYFPASRFPTSQMCFSGDCSPNYSKNVF